MKGKFLSLLFMLIISSEFCKKSFSQLPYTFRINASKELPTQVVYDMMADSKGFIWVATDLGLFKFNSRTFEKIPFEETTNTNIGFLRESPDGKIWCCNFYRQIYFYENDTLRNFNVKDVRFEKLTNIVNFEVTTEKILIGSHDLFFEVSMLNHKIKSIQIQKNNYLTYFENTKNGLYLFNTNNYFLVKNYLIKKNNYPIPFQQIISCKSKHELIIGIDRSQSSNNAFSLENNTFKLLPNFKLSSNDEKIYLISSTVDEEYFICTSKGAYLWDIKKGNTKLIFNKGRVSAVVKDYQGNYWISTLDKGLFKISNLNTQLIISSADNDLPKKIIKLPNKHFVIGYTSGKIIEIDKKGRLVKAYKSTSNNEIEFLFFDSLNNKLYSDAGIFSNETGNCILEYDFGKSLDINNNNLIVGHFNKAVILDPDFYKNKTINKSAIKNSIKLNAERNSILLRNKRTNFVLNSKLNNGYWIAYDDGLFFYPNKGKAFEVFNKNNQSIIASHLCQLSDGGLVISSNTNGLIFIDNKGNLNSKLNSILKPSKYIKKTLSIEKELWILDDQGLKILNLQTGKTKDLFLELGIDGIFVSDFIVFDNSVFFTTSDGIIKTDYLTNKSFQSLYFPEFFIKQDARKIKSNQIFKHYQNNFEIEFYALNYLSSKNLFYYYRLIGFDSVWKKTSSNQLIYNALSPGSYNFEVFASSEDFSLKSKIKHQKFTLLKPFWLEAWFFLIMFFLILLLLVGLFNLRIRKIKKGQVIKENILKSKLIAIRSQMNPHFLYNVLNTVQGLVYSNKKNEAASMLGDFSDLMRKTLDTSEKQEIKLSEELAALELYLNLEKMRFNNDFNYTFNLQKNLEKDSIIIPSMLIQPFIENSIKHGFMHSNNDKLLRVEISQIEDYLIVKIDDNGIGRNASSEINAKRPKFSSGFAIKASQNRLDLMNEISEKKIHLEIIDKTDSFGKSLGTLVILKLPIKYF